MMAPVQREKSVRRSGRVVEGDGLENRSAKAPGVRIPPPPPSQRRDQARTAPARARCSNSTGCCCCHDAKFPSATACIAGAPVRGSWWGHPKGKLIYETLSRMEDTVAWAKLVLGKETLVHRRLWPALVAAAESRQDWQLRGLKADAKRLLQRVRAGRPSAPRGPAGDGPQAAAVATELERRLLARGASEHTPSGHHARFLETWGAWAGRTASGGASCPTRPRRSQALSAPVLAWAGEGRRPPGLAPLARPAADRAAPLRRPARSTIVGREFWRGGREAEGGGLLNRYTAQKLYRGFESLPLRNFCRARRAATGAPSPTRISASLSSMRSPETSTTIFSSWPVNANGAR